MTSEDGHNLSDSNTSTTYQALDRHGIPLEVCSIVREIGFVNLVAIVVDIRKWHSFGKYGVECLIDYVDGTEPQWINDGDLISAEREPMS